MNLEDLVSFCKRRGFVYQSSILYGGLQGFYDYGPLGVELKNNIKKSWWKANVYNREDVYGLDSSVVLNQEVLRNSGHLDGFEDVFIDCKKCKLRFKAEVIEDKCINCGSFDLTEAKSFNLMMNVNLGPIAGEFGSLRPETAQSIFINFKNVTDSFSCKAPFGIAQIGKAFRNEVTPKNFLLRMREFEQMELEYFVKPGENLRYFEMWKELRKNWWKEQGVDVQYYNQTPKELAHYANCTTDLMYNLFGSMEELEGVCDRTDFDLGSHTKNQDEFNIKAKVNVNKKSVNKLNFQDESGNYLLNVIESSAGLDRAFMAILASAYCVEEDRVVLKLPKHLSPVKVAIIPLAKNNDEIVKYSYNLLKKLKKETDELIILEAGGNIGKCYKKNDEIGTYYCVTVDFETINEQKDTVTIRERDSMKQTRVNIDELRDLIK